MKHKLITLAFIFLSLPLFSIAAVHVNGYYRSNGTYVAPHYRSNPDGNPYNNYSYPGNTNPYTGVTATGNADTYLNNYYSKSSSHTTRTSTYTPTSSPYYLDYTSNTSNSSYYSKVPYGNMINHKLFCDVGAYKSSSGNFCIQEPMNGHSDGAYDFTCDDGYHKTLDACIYKDNRNVSYVSKLWADNNPDTSCLDSTFLRNREKNECIFYKSNKDLFTWTVTTSEFDGIHYMYDSKTEKVTSCPDGYKNALILKTYKCVAEK